MDATWSTGSPLATAEAVPVWSSGSPLATVPKADEPDPEGVVWSTGSPLATVSAYDPDPDPEPGGDGRMVLTPSGWQPAQSRQLLTASGWVSG